MYSYIFHDLKHNSIAYLGYVVDSMSHYVYSITCDIWSTLTRIRKFGTTYNDKHRPRAYVVFFGIYIQALAIGI